MKNLFRFLIPVLLLAALSISAKADQTSSVDIGGKFTITVTAGGTEPFTYQWKKNGVNIPGATGNTYHVENVTADDAANYTVTVSNYMGSTESDTAAITILVKPPTDARVHVTAESAQPIVTSPAPKP